MPEETTVIKAHNGDRAANLDGIADQIDELLDDRSAQSITLDAMDARKLVGYGEQLRIIAKEIRDTPGVLAALAWHDSKKRR